MAQIQVRVGIAPTGNARSGTDLTLQFPRELTTAEKAELDRVMAEKPGYPPKPEGTVFEILDIGERADPFNERTGLSARLYFRTVGNAERPNRLLLYYDRKLTEEEVARVIQVYADSIRQVS